MRRRPEPNVPFLVIYAIVAIIGVGLAATHGVPTIYRPH